MKKLLLLVVSFASLNIRANVYDALENELNKEAGKVFEKIKEEVSTTVDETCKNIGTEGSKIIGNELVDTFGYENALTIAKGLDFITNKIGKKLILKAGDKAADAAFGKQ